jgi:uncharacterized protein YdhG (YjbR/CyaY superfamily)
MKPRESNRKRSSKPAKASKPETPGDYLAALTSDQRRALERLRKTIKTAAPGAEECISYGLPAFCFKGKFLVAYGAAANHCAFYPGSVVQMLKDELKGYGTSKGTLRFPTDKPIPAELVQKLVKLRIARM